MSLSRLAARWFPRLSQKISPPTTPPPTSRIQPRPVMDTIPQSVGQSAETATAITTASTATNTTVNYTTWDTASLISRIQTLESSLAEARSLIPAPKPGQPRRPLRQIDSSKHTTRLIAIKFAYLGQHYGGYEFHGNDTSLPTVEETLFLALLKSRLVTALPGADPESITAWPGDEAASYSKCGRTDKGVSAFGQVVGVRVRSTRPTDPEKLAEWDEVRDEMPYTQILNRLLPHSIRVLSWAPNPPADFSARFNCRARHYRYFFTNPMLSPQTPNGKLDIEAMKLAASYFIGDHDFRNFCKLDASKQIENFNRVILHASIEKVEDGAVADSYYFDLRGSAFLWHQVRHMMAVLFLVGQGHEAPEVVKEMLDLNIYPTKPAYEMADDRPLVLWDCVFPEEELKWVAADEEGVRGALADTTWMGWHEKKIDLILAEGLVGLVEEVLNKRDAQQQADFRTVKKRVRQKEGHVLILGSGEPVQRGKYVKMVERKRMRPVGEINKAYLERKGDWREKRERKRKAQEEAERMEE
ncbi:Similar to tRNA pseudouridine(38/39) synthase; acc. no. P31115 [Pyronema omphalodes CBS 100304]|uniref:Similar to tRNA pseudouridine(38/39) synthase acc. no. P31115 n=1 Tax=Pyronema omphalodes (strain CBS 100304) TaxID=1076935 RepID=U4LSG2_PYROM|nr:Similar to tRNA pseudouridine(38/39) synthase; acc. no. P31115 [Pyronema omphalodes CBS 100304]